MQRANRACAQGLMSKTTLGFNCQFFLTVVIMTRLRDFANSHKVSKEVDGRRPALTPRKDNWAEYHRIMIRTLCTPRALARLALATALLGGFAPVTLAQAAKPGAKPAAAAAKPAAKQEAPAPTAGSTPIGQSGDWGIYVAGSGPTKQCYVAAKPAERAPANLQRDPAFFFISTRPAEKVNNEISIIMGFPAKADKPAPELQVGSEKFVMAAQGPHLWVKEAARNAVLVEAMRRGTKLTIKATSMRGNLTTDTYPLNGIAGALDRVKKECP